MRWKSDCKVSLRSYSRRHIDVMIDEDSERLRWRKDLERQLQRLNKLTPSDAVLGDIVDTKLALSIEADKEELYWE
ncbi:hypothetical protein J1N35_029466 [Gossypium stocksii]|uniref:Uncharacterized protein n=1 Tax=Gossypium stocksii TaxID=47602 RepID=A0A9D3ZTT5_9ROSI|nr:hypothetical protein J1N35_029466 [Gossypium stocksii]